MKNIEIKSAIILFVFVLSFLFLNNYELDAKGGSFGGRRSSPSPSMRSAPRRVEPSAPVQRPNSSFGSKPSTPGGGGVPMPKTTSFGGKRLTNSSEYTSKYGIPRQTDTKSLTSSDGVVRNYNFHDYGGYSSGLMTGYMMGSTSWMWMMPFHPAFYYSRPYEVHNEDGSIEVYPPTFSFEKLIFTLLVIAGIIFVIRHLVLKRRGGAVFSRSSFS